MIHFSRYKQQNNTVTVNCKQQNLTKTVSAIKLDYEEVSIVYLDYQQAYQSLISIISTVLSKLQAFSCRLQ